MEDLWIFLSTIDETSPSTSTVAAMAVMELPESPAPKIDFSLKIWRFPKIGVPDPCSLDFA
jgi:hypothetical protein